jgi:SGNH hydrolase-like domain, acetyltransferase AlgX
MVDQLTPPPSRWDRLVAVAFVAALAIPGAALIAGARPPELDNANPAAMPSLSVTALTDTTTYAEVDAFVADNLPGRDFLLRAYGDLDYRLLGGSTTPQVIVGREDWLFFQGELRPTCGGTAEALLDGVDVIGAEAKTKGIDLHFMIAPDKHSIHPEMVRASPVLPEACTDARRAAMRAGMAARPDTTLDLWSTLLKAREGAAEPLYFSQDSHWTPTGALPAIGALVDAVEPGVWDPSQISVDGTSIFGMELARLIGLPRNAVVPAYVVRPDIKVTRSTIPTAVHLNNAADLTDYRATGKGPLVKGTTLFIYDSFFNISRPRITPWFERSIWVHMNDLRDHPEIARDLPPVDHIVVERVEREIYGVDLPKLLAPILDPKG